MYNGKHFIIADRLEIFYKDLPAGKTFDQYKSLCLALKGDGWRIPTINELSYMYGLHTLDVLGFDHRGYYLSSDNHMNSLGEVIGQLKMCIYFLDGSPTAFRELDSHRVRPVRTISL